MPPLIQKWNVLKDEDKDLFPLLEVSNLALLFIFLSIHFSFSEDVHSICDKYKSCLAHEIT